MRPIISETINLQNTLEEKNRLISIYKTDYDEFQAYNIENLVGSKLKQLDYLNNRDQVVPTYEESILKARKGDETESSKKVYKNKNTLEEITKSVPISVEKQVSIEIGRAMENLDRDSNLSYLDKENRAKELQEIDEVFQINFENFQKEQNLTNGLKLGESINKINEKLGIDVNEMMKISDDLNAQKSNDGNRISEISTPISNISYLAVTPGLTYSDSLKTKHSEIKKESVAEAEKYSMEKLNKNLSDLTTDERKNMLREISIKIEEYAETENFNDDENVKNVKILDGILSTSEEKLQFNRLIIGDIVSKSVESLKEEILKYSKKYNPKNVKEVQKYSEMIVKNIAENYKLSIDEKIKINTRVNTPEVIIRNEPEMTNVNGYYDVRNNKMIIVKEEIPKSFNSFNELLYHEMTHYITTELRKYQQQMTARSFEIKNELEVNTGNTSVVKELENQQRYIDSINGEIDILKMGRQIKIVEGIISKNWEASDDENKRALALSLYAANPDEYQAFNVQGVVSDKLDIIKETKNKTDFIKKEPDISVNSARDLEAKVLVNSDKPNIKETNIEIAGSSGITRKETDNVNKEFGINIKGKELNDREIMRMMVDEGEQSENHVEMSISSPNMQGLELVSLGSRNNVDDLMYSVDRLEKTLNIYDGKLDVMEANETLKNMSWDEKRASLEGIKENIEEEKIAQKTALLDYDRQVELNEMMTGYLVSEQQAPYYNRLVIGDIMTKSIGKHQELLNELRTGFSVMSEKEKEVSIEKLIKAIDEEYMIFAVEKLGIMSEYTTPELKILDLNDNLAGGYEDYELALNRKDLMTENSDDLLKTVFHEVTHYINQKLLVDSTSMMNTYKKDIDIYRQGLISKMNILNDENRMGLTDRKVKVNKEENEKKIASIIKELETLDSQLKKMERIKGRVNNSRDNIKLAEINPVYYKSRLAQAELYQELAQKKDILSENKSSEKAENELKYIETVFNQLDRIYIADQFQEDIMEYFGEGSGEQARRYEKFYVANYDEYQGFHVEKLIRDKFEQLDFLREQVKREKE